MPKASRRVAQLEARQPTLTDDCQDGRCEVAKGCTSEACQRLQRMAETLRTCGKDCMDELVNETEGEVS